MQTTYTEKEAIFIKELKELLEKHDASIRQFEGEFIIEFEQIPNLWLNIYEITKDNI